MLFARPSVAGLAGGLVPRLPPGERNWLPLIGLFGTTFSIAGAFYQAYLVREKGWTTSHLKQGVIDSALGIALLGGLTVVIMATSAAVLAGRAEELRNAADVARQLEPLFGKWAGVLFGLGLFAAAFSSFMVNAMVGGTLLSDGLGLGGSMDQPGPKAGTVLALLIGMGVAVWVALAGSNAGMVVLIIIAQSLTVLGGPMVAVALLWLATRRDLQGARRIPLWMKLFAVAACLAMIPMAIRAALSVYAHFNPAG
jgi:manganese transport protein